MKINKLQLPFLFIIFISRILTGCTSKPDDEKHSSETSLIGTMQATIAKRQLLANIPSASGMEVVGDHVYIIGDDSPYLYVLNTNNFRQVGQAQLFDTKFFVTGRIPKALKPDLECLMTLDLKGQKQVMAFGSGSAPTRTQCYVIQVPAQGLPSQVKEYSLKQLYTALQTDKKILGNEQLNLEAAATDNKQIFLLQRSTGAETNMLLAFDAQEFTQYLADQSRPLPKYQAIFFELPHLESLQARFSGAYIFNNLLFFTASVENTQDAILDGEVLGSFVGWIDLASVKPSQDALTLNTALVLDADGNPYQGKVESLAILSTKDNNKFRSLAITDNDNGQSELLELDIVLK